MMNPSDGAVPPFALRLFGPFDARVNGLPLPRLRSRKGQWLLALLALRHGRAVERSWLAETLWPDSPPKQAYGSLRITLADLRRALGTETYRLGSPTPATLRLDLAGADVDVIAFDAAVARGDAASLETAVARRRGPLLEGCPAEWVPEERQPRLQAYLAALETLAAEALQRDDPAAAERCLRLALVVDPLRETTQRALMQALAAGGSYAAAGQVYRDLRLLLHRELNATPAPETVALFETIRATAGERGREGARGRAREREGAPPLLASASSLAPSLPRSLAPSLPPPRLPSPLTELVGREAQVAAVRGSLKRSRLVTLTGPGGIGKTRLAIRIAEDLARELAEGVWFVELAALTEAALVPRAVATALGLKGQTDCRVKEAVIALLCGKEGLLVLDNCEHQVEACATLAAELLRDCPCLRILATSRQPLGLTGEAVRRVPGLSLPGPGTMVNGQWLMVHEAGPNGRSSTISHQPSTILASEAVRLFIERATDMVPEFVLTAANAPSVARICRQLDGVPLAIELAAARLRCLSVEEIAARLDDRFRLLTGGSRSALPRHQTLRATMDWSHSLLSEPERVLLRRLAVFAGGFTLEAAEGVCSDGDRRTTNDERRTAEEGPGVRRSSFVVRQGEVLDLLAKLVDKSLVQHEERADERRYRLLETARQYAWEKLCQAGEWEAARGRHGDWYGGLAEQAASGLKSPRQGQWLDRLEREHENLRAALAWRLEAGGRTAAMAGLRLAAALTEFWAIRGYWTEGRKWLTVMLESANPEPPDKHAEDAVEAVRARALAGAGMFAEQHRDLATARRLLEESRGISCRRGDRAGIAATLRGLAMVAESEGGHSLAWSLCRESLAIRREIGDAWEIAESLSQLGALARARWQAETAEPLLREALEIQRALGDQRGTAKSLNALGGVARLRGDYPAARRCLEEALVIVRAVGDREETAAALVALAGLAHNQGDYETARALFEDGLAGWRELGARGGVAGALLGLGRVAMAQGDLAGARPFLTEALTISRERNAPRTAAWTLGLLAELALHEGDVGKAIAPAEESMAIRRHIGNPRGIAGSLFVLGHVALFRGDASGARALYRESLEIWRDQGSQAEFPIYLEALAEVARRQGEDPRAARLWGAAEALRERMGVPLPPVEQPRHEASVTAARAALGNEAFVVTWAEGRAMSRDAAITEALS